MSLRADLEDIATTLLKASANPDGHTKQELANLLAAAGNVLGELATILDDKPDYHLDKINPKGNA